MLETRSGGSTDKPLAAGVLTLLALLVQRGGSTDKPLAAGVLTLLAFLVQKCKN
jgi:hypothetical protein